MLLRKNIVATCLAFIILFSSCLTAERLDKFVAEQYNNQLPPVKKKKPGIEVLSSAAIDEKASISVTRHKNDKFLPLLVYWKYDHQYNCSLNPAAAVANFTNAIHTQANKALIDKLNGRTLELTVEEAPAAFSIVLKENLVWVVYAVTWARVYIKPDDKDLVVAYKVVGAEGAPAGRITIKNVEKARGLRYFQSWKSATTEYLNDYNSSFTTMAKSLVNQLVNQL